MLPDGKNQAPTETAPSSEREVEHDEDSHIVRGLD
jgi:hypothetical protein